MSDKKKGKGKAAKIPADEPKNKEGKKKVEPKKLPQVPAGMSHA